LHRTASVNEYSTRYSEAINDKQETKTDSWRKQSKNNKQGSGDYIKSYDSEGFGGDFLTDREVELHGLAERVYRERLQAGVAREQARKDLPLSTYTEAYWKIDLHNLLHFLKLRLDPHAQKEIREYATAIAKIVKVLFPLTWEAFTHYILYAKTFSKNDLDILSALLTTGDANAILEACGYVKYNGKRGTYTFKSEFKELQEKLKDVFDLEKSFNENIITF
jgi:thymidylate synthase (FAD)